MYGITSYKKNGYDPFKELRAWQKTFFGDEGQAGIKTDIRDTGDNGYIRRERYYGSVSRSFNISEVDAAAITAKHENGVLSLTLPKKKEELPKSHKIEIN